MNNMNLNIGLIGIGNVGLQVAKELVVNDRLSNLFKIESILVRDLDKYKKIIASDNEFSNQNQFVSQKLTDNEDRFFGNDKIDVVIELIGGTTPALDYAKRALISKKHVISANKELIANHFIELSEISKSNNVKLRFEGAVGAGIPIIEVLSDMLKQNKIERITGIINGTSNFILSSMFEKSSDFNEVLREAQDLGFAESDPTNDIEGYDAKFKINILGSIAFGAKIPLDKVFVKGISEISDKDMIYAKEFGYNIKLLATTEKTSKGICSSVCPVLVPLDHPMAKVDGNYNAVEILGDLVGNLWIQGEGAGKNSTSSAVLGDLMGIYHQSSDDIYLNDLKQNYLSEGDVISKNYIRLSVEDKHGVLSSIAGIFSENEISIASIIQKDIKRNNQLVDLVIMTHESKGINFDNALNSILKLDVVKEKPVSLRIH